MSEIKKILVIDDSLFQRRVLSDMLKKNKFTVIEAKDGREGLEKLEKENPDLITLDLLMPDMNGIEVIKKARDISSSTPIIVLSADIQQTVKDECEALGIAGFLNKPAKENQLIEAVTQALGS